MISPSQSFDQKTFENSKISECHQLSTKKYRIYEYSARQFLGVATSIAHKIIKEETKDLDLQELKGLALSEKYNLFAIIDEVRFITT